MADLISVTAPLMIRCPTGSSKVMLERFRHPDGLLFFELYWERLDGTQGVYLIEGEVRGDGPWKVGDCVVTVLACQGTQPDLAADFAQWRLEVEQGFAAYPPRAEIVRLARARGALVD